MDSDKRFTADLMEAIEVMATQPRRWAVVRTGERDPIPSPLRWSVYLRDDYTCKRCPNPVALEPGQIELDHCIPWSAGGPDDSSNLRVLCSWCNQERSNYVDWAHETTYRPTTWWCVDCWAIDEHGNRPRHRNLWKDGCDPNVCPLIDPHGETPEPDYCLAYCAHCGYYSTSPYYLDGEMGRRLLAAMTRTQQPQEPR